MPPPSRERACARLSLITVSSATGVSGLCRQRAAPSSSAMRRKSGAGESSNMRHEDIDDHQVEGCLVERRESAGAPSETATLNPFAPEPCPYREANVRVTVDNQNAAHHDLLAIAGRLRLHCDFCCANQLTILVSAASGDVCLPGKVHKHQPSERRSRREPSATPDHFLEANVDEGATIARPIFGRGMPRPCAAEFPRAVGDARRTAGGCRTGGTRQ
jgi:hypothetical protein